MPQTVQEAHPALYHYTTASGLEGIIKSQQLRATNISFLNDDEEHIGFFNRRLPHLLREAATAAVAEVSLDGEGKEKIRVRGGAKAAVEELTSGFAKSITETSLKLNIPYVASFCAPIAGKPPDDGLLSQWRGYGHDGGYAIVFDSVGLNELLLEEAKRFRYVFAIWSDVEYYNRDTQAKAIHPETLEYEEKVKAAANKFMLTHTPEDLQPLFEPIIALSCLHKHAGFSEEAEVRIVALLPTPELAAEMKLDNDIRIPKPVEFACRDGVAIPYITLFGENSNGEKARLPITKVIVGPHPERDRRRRAVEMLLAKHEISADVVVSDIPYRGK
jgi:hypothetical protein